MGSDDHHDHSPHQSEDPRYTETWYWNLVDPETSGYSTTAGKQLYQELIPYFGLLLVDKEGNANDISKTQLSFGQTVGSCDFNQNGVIDVRDMQKVLNF